jgi:gas vesicle protein
MNRHNTQQEQPQMNGQMKTGRDYRLTIGFVAGAAVGAAVATWFGPQLASGVRDRMTRAGETAGKLARKGRDARNGVADAVARGAQAVERVARSARSDDRVVPSVPS